MDLKDISTKKLILELSTRENIKEILVVKGIQDFDITIGREKHLFNGPAKILVIDERRKEQ